MERRWISYREIIEEGLLTPMEIAEGVLDEDLIIYDKYGLEVGIGIRREDIMSLVSG